MKKATVVLIFLLIGPSVVVAQHLNNAGRLETPASISDIPIEHAGSSYGSRGINGPVMLDFASLAQIDDDSDAGLSPPVTGNTMGGSESGGGAGAAEAVNPGAPISQLQFQNVFVPESYGSSGYSNQFIIQPVFAVNLNPNSFFDYHVVRPTLPILEPNPDPDGPVGDVGGVGDLTFIDIFVRQTKKKGVIWGAGPIAILPTSSNRQTGLGEWQLGPSFALLDSSKKNWIFGGLAQVPFSLESDAYSVLFTPVFTRLLKNERYIGVGDLIWKLDDQNGNYNIPLSFRVGKVFKFGKQPVNVFLQPQYTPRGLTSQPTANYGLKFSVTFLLPGAEFGYSKDRK